MNYLIPMEAAQVDEALSLALTSTQRLLFKNVNVAASSFVSDTTYSDFPYRAAVSLSGVTAADDPDVTFSVADATSGKFAPVADTYAGGVYIYAAEKPTSTITIPLIICFKG